MLCGLYARAVCNRERQPHIPSQFSRCTQIFSRKVMWVEKTSSTNIEFRNLKVLSNFVTFQTNYSGSSVTTFWFVCLHLNIVTRHSPILPLCHTSLATFGVKIRLFLKTAGVTQLFSDHILKNCYCDERDLGKWVGDPLKIVQNESVKKKNTF